MLSLAEWPYTCAFFDVSLRLHLALPIPSVLDLAPFSSSSVGFSPWLLITEEGLFADHILHRFLARAVSSHLDFSVSSQLSFRGHRVLPLMVPEAVCVVEWCGVV